MKTHRPGVKSQTPADKTGFLNQLYSTFSLEAASGWNPIQTAIKVPKHLSGPGPVGGRGTLQNGAEQRRKRWVGGWVGAAASAAGQRASSIGTPSTGKPGVAW